MRHIKKSYQVSISNKQFKIIRNPPLNKRWSRRRCGEEGGWGRGMRKGEMGRGWGRGRWGRGWGRGDDEGGDGEGGWGRGR